MAYLSKLPGTGSTLSAAPYDDADWSDPGNITADDGTKASVTVTHYAANGGPERWDSAYFLKASNFDFSAIPAGSTIDGVYCKAEIYCPAEDARIDDWRLLDTGGSPTGDDKGSPAVAIASADPSYVEAGGAADKWGCALTRTWVQDPDFGVVIGVSNCDAGFVSATVYVDYIMLGVYYTPPPGGGARSLVQSWLRPSIISGG